MVNPQSTPPKLTPFPLPEPAIARHPGAMLAPRELRAWTESLPLGNPPRAAQLVLHQLRLLVRDPDPGSRLPPLLALYQAPIDRLLEIVEERMEKNQDLAIPLDNLEQALLDVLTELAYGQLRIANDQLLAGKPPDPALLYHAMERLDTAHNVERLHYHRRDAASWRLMTEIFLHADARGIGATPVDTAARRHGAPTHIDGLFFRALIIGLCDPHHQRPGDILAWHRWIGGHTDTLKLGVLPQGAFSIPIDTSGDLAPLTGARRGKPGPDMRYLLAEEFLRNLHEDENAPGGLYKALSDLIKGRKTAEQRTSPRQPRNHPFGLLYGLRQVHTRLGELTSGLPVAEPGHGQIACVQINQSKTGAAFRLQGPLNPPLGIGETILAEASNPKPGGAPIGFIGRIQRLVADSDGVIEIGVEKLVGGLMPVTLSGGAAERARGDTYALLQHSPESNHLLLLAIRNVYREGDTVIAEGVNSRYTLRMHKLQQTTRRVAYIEVEVVD